MASVPFHYVDLRAFSYGTEDDERVEAALREYLPEEADVERTVSEGHYGDRICVFSARVENADDVRHVLSRVATLEDIDAVRTELEERVDDNCSFFLTLDKQRAYEGIVERGDGITLRAKVEAYPATRAGAIENAREALDTL